MNATQSCNLEVSRLRGRTGPEQAVRAMEEAQDASDRHQIREASWWRRRLNCIWKDDEPSQETGKRDRKADEQGSICKQPGAQKELVQAHTPDPGPWLKGSLACQRMAVSPAPCPLPSRPCPHHQSSDKTFQEPLLPLWPLSSPETPPRAPDPGPRCHFPDRSASPDLGEGREQGWR